MHLEKVSNPKQQLLIIQIFQSKAMKHKWNNTRRGNETKVALTQYAKNRFETQMTHHKNN